MMRFWWFNFWFYGWNGLGIVWFLIGSITGLLTFIVTSRFYGESIWTKTVSWIVWGATILLIDLVYRIIMRKVFGKKALVHPETGGWGCFFFPMWVIGIAILAGASQIYSTR